MPTRKLASFPNSRIRPRPATREAFARKITIPVGAPVKILDANLDRTYFSLENVAPPDEANNNTLKFGYAPQGAEGSPPADLVNQGWTILPGSGLADEPSPQEVWAINLGDVIAAGPGSDIIISIEEGQG